VEARSCAEVGYRLLSVCYSVYMYVWRRVRANDDDGSSRAVVRDRVSQQGSVTKCLSVCLSVRLFPLWPTDLDLDFLHVAFDYRISYATARDAGLTCARKFYMSQLNLAHGTMCAWVVSCERKLAEVNCRLVREIQEWTDRQTDTLIATLCSPIPGRSIVIKRQTRVLSVSVS